MREQIQFVINSGEDSHSLFWLSFLDSGGISVGMKDRTLIIPRFKSRQFLFNIYNRITTTYIVSDNPEATEPIVNPHFTFHPPIYFHLRANRGEELFAGIADIGLIIKKKESVPWIRLVSRPVCELIKFSGARAGESSDVATINVPTADCSIGIGIDFVGDWEIPILDNHLFEHTYEWNNWRLHVHALQLAPQNATLSWMHQS